MNFFKIIWNNINQFKDLNNLIVIHDDLDNSIGKAKLKIGGSAGYFRCKFIINVINIGGIME